MTIEEMKKRKQELGYSYEQIAQQSGVPIGTVQKVLGGITKNPRHGTLQAIGRVLGNQISESVSSSQTPGNISASFTYDIHSSSSDSMIAETKRTYLANKVPAPLHGSGENRKYTLSDRECFPEERRTELIDGVVYDMASPTGIHQIIAGEIYTQIRSFITEHQGNCVPLLSPLDVILDRDEYTVVQPDLLIVCAPDSQLFKYVWGAPDFVLEILSPSTKKKDQTLKLHKYYDAGVREYWIIDPYKETVVVYNLAAMRGDENADGNEISLFGFKDLIPIMIYNGDLQIDMKQIKSFLGRFHHLDDDSVPEGFRTSPEKS